MMAAALTGCGGSTAAESAASATTQAASAEVAAEDEWENDYYYKISHCPFCGKPIEITVVGEEDMDEYHKVLSKQRDELWKKYNRTDSKKKSEELRKQVQELDDQINWLYHLAEYKKVEDKKNE